VNVRVDESHVVTLGLKIGWAHELAECRVTGTAPDDAWIASSLRSSQ